jgi:hypothetical protein
LFDVPHLTSPSPSTISSGPSSMPTACS